MSVDYHARLQKAWVGMFCKSSVRKLLGSKDEDVGGLFAPCTSMERSKVVVHVQCVGFSQAKVFKVEIAPPPPFHQIKDL